MQQRIIPAPVAEFDHTETRSSATVLLSQDARLHCQLQDNVLHAYLLHKGTPSAHGQTTTGCTPIVGMADPHSTPVQFAALVHDPEHHAAGAPPGTPTSRRPPRSPSASPLGGQSHARDPSAAHYVVTCSRESFYVHALQLPDVQQGVPQTTDHEAALYCRCVVKCR